MNREILMAFCFSAAFHAAVVGFCPVPSQDNPGDRGNSQNIVVLGVIEFAPAEQNPMEISQAVEEIEKPEDSPEPSQPEPANDSEPSPKEKIAMVKAADPPVNEAPLPAENVIPGKPALTQGRIQDVRFRYLQGVMRKLENAKQYPPHAYRCGMEGTTKVEFTIRANGRAADIAFLKPSDHPVLDSAAQSMIVRASPFDPIPVELGQEEMAVRVPIAFRIEEVRRGRPH